MKDFGRKKMKACVLSLCGKILDSKHLEDQGTKCLKVTGLP